MLSYEKKENILNFLKVHNIKENEYCILGSAILEELGLRKANDIDICVSSNILERLKQESYKTITEEYERYSFENNIEIKNNYKTIYFRELTDDEIINNAKYHTILNGLKFLKPEILMTTKNIRNCPIDQKDCILLYEYSKNHDWDWFLVKDANVDLNKLREEKKCNSKLQVQNKKINKNNFFFKKTVMPNKTKYYFLNIPIFKIKRFNNKIKKYFLFIPFYKKYENERYVKKYFLGIQYKVVKKPIQIPPPPIDLPKMYCDTYFFENSLLYFTTPARILANQYIDKEFCTLDTVVRYLAVQNYYGENDFGFELYKKMQIKRGVWDTHNINTFKNCIQSIEKNGLDISIPLEFRGDGLVNDGSHRLAIALYKNIPYLTAINVNKYDFTRNYGVNWFKNNGFSDEELEIIDKTKRKLFFEYGVYYPVILWSPIQDYYDEITYDIRKNPKIDIIKEQIIDFPDKEKYFDFVKDVYKTDDITEWKVIRKTAFMKNYTPKAKIIWVEHKCRQHYRKKAVFNDFLSIESEIMKTEIRHKYKNKINNYIWDIICHISDNPNQNRKVNNIIKYTNQEN